MHFGFAEDAWIPQRKVVEPRWKTGMPEDEQKKHLRESPEQIRPLWEPSEQARPLREPSKQASHLRDAGVSETLEQAREGERGRRRISSNKDAGSAFMVDFLK